VGIDLGFLQLRCLDCGHAFILLRQRDRWGFLPSNTSGPFARVLRSKNRGT
jgi:hypothetical protein